MRSLMRIPGVPKVEGKSRWWLVDTDDLTLIDKMRVPGRMKGAASRLEAECSGNLELLGGHSNDSQYLNGEEVLFWWLRWDDGSPDEIVLAGSGNSRDREILDRLSRLVEEGDKMALRVFRRAYGKVSRLEPMKGLDGNLGAGSVR